MDDFFRYSDSAHDSVRCAGRPYNEDGAYPDELDCDSVTDLCASCGEEIATNSPDSIIVDSDGWIFCCLDCQCEFNSAAADMHIDELGEVAPSEDEEG